jgi:hypothetical protein
MIELERRSSMRRSLLLSALLLCAACKQAKVIFPESTTTPVPAAGGNAMSADGLFTVVVPAGALQHDQTITIATHRNLTVAGARSPVYEVDPGDAPALDVEIRLSSDQAATSVLATVSLADGSRTAIASSSAGQGMARATVPLRAASYALIGAETPPPPPPPPPPPVDILVVVDNSGSMDNKQERLVAHIDTLITRLEHVDYQLAVVSTDQDSRGGDLGGSVHFSFKSTTPFTLDPGSYDTSACMSLGIDHGCFLGPDPSTRVIRSSMSAADQLAAAKANLRLGSCGSGTERGLHGMDLALTNTAMGSCNQGFIRPNARLLVVIISDENDSDADAFTGNPPPVSEYVRDLLALKPADKLKLVVIAGIIGGNAANCSINPNDGTPAACGSICSQMPPAGSHLACNPSNPPCAAGEYCDTQHNNVCENLDLQFWAHCNWCSFYNAPDCCTALAANRYIDFTTAFAAAAGPHSVVVESICQSDLGPALEHIYSELIAQ